MFEQENMLRYKSTIRIVDKMAFFLFINFTDSSLMEMVNRVLPLASNYSTVARFIEGNVII